MRHLFRSLFCLSVLALGIQHHAIAETKLPSIFIIMDDIGYRTSDKLAFSLPVEVAFSILPHTPNATLFATHAHEQSRDVMLHLPMASLSSKDLGPGAITTNMMFHEVKTVLGAALESVPFAIGMNNHMGSELTASKEAMQQLMTNLKGLGLFFIDSRTTHLSVAQWVATQQQIPNARRHVFLDHVLTVDFMSQQWAHLLLLARSNGKAIAIVHPHPQTISFLKEKLAALSIHDAQLAPISHYFKAHQRENN